MERKGKEKTEYSLVQDQTSVISRREGATPSSRGEGGRVEEPAQMSASGGLLEGVLSRGFHYFERDSSPFMAFSFALR